VGSDTGSRPLLRLADDLTTLTRSIHDAGAARPAEIEPVPPDRLYGALVELRTALIAGAVPLDGARAIYRYHPSAAAAWSRLEASGWLVVEEDGIRPCAPATALCRRILRVHDEVTSAAWAAPAAMLVLATRIVSDADGIGPAFRTWRDAGWDAAESDAGRLFLVLSTLRYLRADAHAAAWESAGHTARSVAALDPSSSERVAIEEETDARNAAALRRSAARGLDALIGGVAELACQRRP
jgi:hypothetical protein